MSVHRATVNWILVEAESEFLKRRYSRVHRLAFEGGVEVMGTPSPAVVPAPWSRTDAVDPEGAFVASLSACHMLWFLDHAARGGFVVTAYADDAEGTLGRMASGKTAMIQVVLRPAVQFGGDRRPTAQDLAALHHAAHADCFIANSVTTEVVVEGA